MTTGFSNKIIAVSENNQFIETIKDMATKNKLELVHDYKNITSASLIRNACIKTGNTSFIRSQLLQFINENGYPFFIAIDMRTQSGLGNENDPDSMKVLRTFLISHIIISRARSFSNFQSNIIILHNSADNRRIDRINRVPSTILEHIKTTDDKVNLFIKELREESKKFNQLFYIKTINSENPSVIIANEVNIFIKTVNARLRLQYRAEPEKVRLDSTDTAASVVYKLSKGTYYVDGEITSDVPSEYRSLEEGKLYLIGAWSNRTQSEVSAKIVKAITKGLCEEKVFEKDERIIIDAGDRCTVDATATASIAQTLSRDLYAYKNISIKLNNKNRLILEKTKGYSLIRNQVKT